MDIDDSGRIFSGILYIRNVCNEIYFDLDCWESQNICHPKYYKTWIVVGKYMIYLA